jgi:hypothetical protein
MTKINLMKNIHLRDRPKASILTRWPTKVPKLVSKEKLTGIIGAAGTGLAK